MNYPKLLAAYDKLEAAHEKLKQERDALAATVEALQDTLTWAHSQAVDTVRTGETHKIYTVWEIADVEFVSKILSAAPQQHLRDVRAEAVQKAAEALRFAPVDGGHRWAVRYVDLIEHAESLKVGEK